MEKKVLSELDIYVGEIEGLEWDPKELQTEIFESYVLGKRISKNSKDYSFEDYFVSTSPTVQKIHAYFRDFFGLKGNYASLPKTQRTLIPTLEWGNLYQQYEQSYSRTQIHPLTLKDSNDFTVVLGVNVMGDSCDFVMEYNDHRRADRTWHIPMKTSKYVIFPSDQRYFISRNVKKHMNVFFSSNFMYPQQY